MLIIFNSRRPGGREFLATRCDRYGESLENKPDLRSFVRSEELNAFFRKPRIILPSRSQKEINGLVRRLTAPHIFPQTVLCLHGNPAKCLITVGQRGRLYILDQPFSAGSFHAATLFRYSCSALLRFRRAWRHSNSPKPNTLSLSPCLPVSAHLVARPIRVHSCHPLYTVTSLDCHGV